MIQTEYASASMFLLLAAGYVVVKVTKKNKAILKRKGEMK